VGLSGWKNAEKEAVNYGQRIEALTKQAENEKNKKKRNGIIVGAIVLAIVAVVIAITQFIIPEQKYNDAIALMDDKKYEEAIAVFESLNGYKESNAKIEECNNEIAYLFATDLMEKGNYIEAYNKFIQMDGYKDSNEKMEQCFNEYLKSIAVGSTLSFGDIEWLVLAKEEGRVLVISKNSIGDKAYDGSTWATCSLRNWLNTSFYNDTFTDFEQSKILTTTVKAENNPKYDTSPGNDTEDKIFLLSIQEAEKYFASDNARSIGEMWWLRSPGGTSHGAAKVDDDGYIDVHGRGHVSDDRAVRPAMWISIE
ncbi:MAG: hypothetical protein J6E46_10785, partial [Faecalicoccus sp.]|nr:hypothetical protein [Faecalicoccus sp.]